MSYDFRPSIKQFFERNEKEIPFANLTRDIARNFFDLMRNILIVGGLKYLAEKTADPYVYIIFGISFAVLSGLVWSHIVWWNIRLFVHLPWKKAGAAIDAVINILLAIGLMLIAMQAVDAAIYQIAAAQAG